jgi:hypothetical protein
MLTHELIKEFSEDKERKLAFHRMIIRSIAKHKLSPKRVLMGKIYKFDFSEREAKIIRKDINKLLKWHADNKLSTRQERYLLRKKGVKK